MAKLTITADEKLAVNLIIDLINLHPEFSKEKIKNEFKKNKIQMKTDRFEIIYSIAKRRWIDNKEKIEECENPAKHEPKYIPDIKEYIKKGKKLDTKLSVPAMTKWDKSFYLSDYYNLKDLKKGSYAIQLIDKNGFVKYAYFDLK